MMSTTAKHPDITPVPVQWCEPECNEFIFPLAQRKHTQAFALPRSVPQGVEL